MNRETIHSNLFIENVHFDISYTTPRELGKKLASITLTNCAIQKSKPTKLLFSVGLPQNFPRFFLAEFETGLKNISQKFKVKTELTTTCVSPTVAVFHLTTVGTAVRVAQTKPKIGDLLVCAGSCGVAASGLALLKAYGRNALDKENEATIAQLLPKPYVKEVLALYGRGWISSIEMLGNGLADGVQSFCQVNRMGALIEEELIPTSQSSWRVASLLATNHLRLWALYGGEDFGFIFSCPSKKLESIQKLVPKVKLTPVGTLQSNRAGVHLIDNTGGKVPFESRMWNDLVRRHRSALTKVHSS